MLFRSAALLVIIVVVPLVSFSAALVQQGVETVGRVNAWLKAGNLEEVLSGKWVQPLRGMAEGLLRRTGVEQINLPKVLMNASSALGEMVLSWGKEFLGDVSELMVRIVLLVVLVFYFFRDGPKILKRLQDLSPLSKEQEERLIERIRVLSSQVVWANVATGVAQGIVGGIGLWISGIPALFWGTIMAFTSLIPAVGTALVWLPAVGYLLVKIFL